MRLRGKKSRYRVMGSVIGCRGQRKIGQMQEKFKRFTQLCLSNTAESSERHKLTSCFQCSWYTSTYSHQGSKPLYQAYASSVQRTGLTKQLISPAQMCANSRSTLHTISYPWYKINFKLDTALTKSNAGSSSSFKASIYYRVF